MIRVCEQKKPKAAKDVSASGSWPEPVSRLSLPHANRLAAWSTNDGNRCGGEWRRERNDEFRVTLSMDVPSVRYTRDGGQGKIAFEEVMVYGKAVRVSKA